MARLCNSPGYNLFSHGKHANNGSFEVGLRQDEDEDEESELGLDSSDRLPQGARTLALLGKLEPRANAFSLAKSITSGGCYCP
ncbi:hypothetical protein NL676_005145 [Syzygium grande]|nr:hypothetical protein NL676_005145 [Syzygium grande]